MKQIISRRGWLVMAAALMTGLSLTTGLSSCSSDDDVVQTTTSQGVSTVHVSVGANVGDAGTRSTVVDVEEGGKTKHTLQFTKGDQLYVYGKITPSGTFPEKYIAGFLDCELTEGSAATATFSGDLQVYEDKPYPDPETGEWAKNLVESSYDFAGADPLVGTRATLKHSGTAGQINVDGVSQEINFHNYFCINAEDVMTSSLPVQGDYNASTGDYALSASSCIVECTFTDAPQLIVQGVEPFFKVSYWSGADVAHLTKQSEAMFQQTNKDITFAFIGDRSAAYHQIRFETDNYGTVTFDLGQKSLQNGKTYKVSRSWDTFSVTSNTTDAVPAPLNPITKAYVFRPIHGYNADYCDINLSGNGVDDYINLSELTENHINIRNLTAACTKDDELYYNFIYSWGGNYSQTTINVTGTNSVICRGEDINNSNRKGNFIFSEGDVKLSGNGTLTITSKSPYECGIRGLNYKAISNSYATTTQLDVSEQLAAPGYKVIRSARTDNAADGTYTWTYTVSPDQENNPFTLTDADDSSTLTPTSWGVYAIMTERQNISVSGVNNSNGIDYRLTLDPPHTITLNHIYVNQTYPVGNFIDDVNGNNTKPLFIKLEGDNYVNLHPDASQYTNNVPANFISSKSRLILRGNGRLIITTADPDNCGIIAEATYPSTAKGPEAATFSANGNPLILNTSKVSTTVTRSPRRDNGDGTYTWVYTVTTTNNN